MITMFCQLLEHAGQNLAYTALREAFGDDVNKLIAAGFLVPGPNSGSIICPECDERHEIELEWDAELGCYRGYCPEVGLVVPQQDQMRTLVLDIESVIGNLRAALRAVEGGTRVLVANRAWFVGRAITEALDWNVILLTSLRSMEEQLEFGEAVKRIPRATLTVALTTSVTPLGFERWNAKHLKLTDVAEFAAGASPCLTMPRDRLLPWLRGFEQGQKTPKGANSGRPATVTEKISEIVDRLAQEGRLSGIQNEDARIIRSEWLAHHPLDKKPPGRSTITQCLRKGPAVARNCQ